MKQKKQTFFFVAAFAICSSLICWHSSACEIHTGYFKYGISIACAAIILLVIWNRTLERTVEEKTSELVDMVRMLENSKEKYREILSSINVGVVVYSSNGEVIICNKKYRQLLGFGEGQLIGNKPLEEMQECFINQDGSKFKFEECPFNMVVETKSPVYAYTLGVKTRTKNDVAWVEMDAIPEYDHENNVDKVIVTFVDVTERINAGKSLVENENKIRAIIKAIPDLFFLINRKGVFTGFISEGNSENLYYKKEDFLGKSLFELFSEEVSEKFQNGLDKLLRTGEVQIVEYPLEINKEMKHFEARLVMCSDDSMLAMVRDITERKISEKRIYEMSMRDMPTNLYNRNYFEEQLKRYQEEKLMNVGMIICDIDGLKLVNDTLGHAQGDECIRTVASILRSCFRKDDVIARIGGDEFAVLMKDVTEEEISIIKTDVKRTAERLNHKQSFMPISISFGYAVLNDQSQNLNDIFKEADEYMYREKIHNLQSSRSKNVDILMKMLEARDFITEGHGERLQELASELSQCMDMSESEIKDMRLLGQFHDIGKVGIPDAILFKPGRLTEEEATVMKRHTEIGYRIARSSPVLLHISDWIFKHHEQWDGSGYPFGMKGDEIPVQCRILSIVDAFDAMTNDRPYRKAMSRENALHEIKRCSGKQFDPMLVEKFIEIVHKTNM